MSRFTSKRVKQRQRKMFWTKMILGFVVFVLFLRFMSWLSHVEQFNIGNINIEGNSAVQTERILEIVNERLAGNYFYLFSKRHILFYPKNKIKAELANSFLRLKSVDIQFADFQSININVLERNPFALWCAKLGEKCYFMDENAFIFEHAPNFPGDVYFKYLGDLISIATATDDEILGQIFLKSDQKSKEGQMPENLFEKVNLFIRYLKDINIEAYKLSVRENGDYELFFGNESKLIFDANQNFGKIFENLRATLIDLGDLEGREFEYMDLRFNNKVLYKFRE